MHVVKLKSALKDTNDIPYLIGSGRKKIDFWNPNGISAKDACALSPTTLDQAGN